MLHTAVLVCCLQATLACSPAGEKPPTYNIQETMQTADIVVYGNYSSDFTGSPEGEAPPHTSKHVTFDVYCVLKSAGLNIPNVIKLNGNYMWHSCFHTDMYLGREMILALENPVVSNQPDGFFRVYEPNIASVGGFDPTEENLKATVDLQNVVKPTGALDVKCPVSTLKTSEDCVTVTISGANKARFALGILVLCIAIFDVIN